MRGLLVGYGSIGRRHLANFYQLGVSDWGVVHTGLGSLPLEPPCPVRAHSSLDQALVDDEPDFVVIANPSNYHLEAANACVRAGRSFLIEKPVSTSGDGLGELAAEVDAVRLSVLVGFQFRFHPALHRIRELIETGGIGTLLGADLVWGEYLPSWQPGVDWRQSYAARKELGGGVHHTICHPLDYLRMIFGDPVSLRASLTQDGPLGLDVAESADALLEVDGGARLRVHLDYWSQPARHGMYVVGTTGSIRWDYLTGDFAVWDDSRGEWQPEDHPGVAARNDLFVAEAEHFLQVLDGRVPSACTLADGIAVVRMCEAIEQSAAGGRVVALPDAGD